MQRFLHALGVDTVTGDEYEPRSISEKVQARLESPLDCVILLVTDDESFWTRDEVAFAKAKGIPVVLLIQHASTFSPGIFGDHEFLQFDKDHVEQTFIGILEAFRYIRSQKRAAPVAQADSLTPPHSKAARIP